MGDEPSNDPDYDPEDDDNAPSPTNGEGAPASEPAGQNDVTAMAAALKKANREAAQARNRLKEYEDATKSDQQKAHERAEEAERRAQTAETGLARMRVAAAKGLPAELADRLIGGTEDEMRADADRLLELVRPRQTTNVPTGARDGQPVNSMDELIRQSARR